MLFAHLKCVLRLGRLRLRGPRGAQDQFTLGAIAQNLRRLAKTRRSTAASSCAVPRMIGVGRQLLLIKSRHPSMDG
jgi:hypothetical protein